MALKTDQKVTITTIAEYLNVSTGTVSNVLSGQAKKRKVSPVTAQKVKTVARKLGYVPNHWARSLKGSKTGIMSLLFNDLKSDWAQGVFDGVIQVLSDTRFSPIIIPYGRCTATQKDWYELEHREIYSILERRDEGVICQPVANAQEDLSQITGKGIPMVFLGSLLEDMRGLENVSSVAWNCVPAVTTAVNHLINSGRKRIGFVGAKHGLVSDNERFDAYRNTLEQAGLEVNSKWVFRGGIFSLPPLETIEAIFLDSEKPDAFFALNDFIAIELLKMLNKIGIRVPEDVAIAGMGDLPISEAYGLTTMSEPLNELGKQSAELLIQQIDSPYSESIHRRIDCDILKVRRTAP